MRSTSVLRGAHALVSGAQRLQLLVHKPFLRFEGEEFSDASLMASLRNFFLFRKQGLNFSMEASYFSGGSQELSQVDAYWQMDLSINKTFFDQRLRLSLFA